MQTIALTLTLTLALASPGAGIPPTQESPPPAWAQWRGPNLDGSSPARDLPARWSTEENVVWRTALPAWSGATPIVWGDSIFVVSPTATDPEALARLEEERARREAEGGDSGRRRGRGGRGGSGRHPGGAELQLLCLDAGSGEVRWRRALDAGNRLYRKGNDASPSPVTDGEHVWVVTGNGAVTALDFAGEVAWQREIQEDYGAFGLNWGYASSPLLVDGLLVIEVLHGTHTDEPSLVIALEAKTGEEAWVAERPTDALRESPDAYTTPTLLRVGDETQIVVSGGDVITGHAVATGEELWRVPGLNPRQASNYRIVASPLVAGDTIVAPTRIQPMLAIRVDEEGRPTEESVAWRWEGRGGPDVPTPTTDGTHLFMVDDAGMVTCVDLATGEALWGPERTQQGTVSASPLLADGKLFVTNEEGVTVVLRAGPEFEELAVNELDGSYTLSSPIAVGNRLYLRTEKFLYCIGKENDE